MQCSSLLVITSIAYLYSDLDLEPELLYSEIIDIYIYIYIYTEAQVRKSEYK